MMWVHTLVERRGISKEEEEKADRANERRRDSLVHEVLRMRNKK
jgi:hypothetical protein